MAAVLARETTRNARGSPDSAVARELSCRAQPTSKGQLVIPKSIRDELHQVPGTEFVISATALGLNLMPRPIFPKATPTAVRGSLARPGRRRLPRDDEAVKTSIMARLKARDAASRQA